MLTESYFPARILTPENYENQSENYISYIKNWWQEKKSEKNLEKIAIFTAYSTENEDYLTIESYRHILEEIFGKGNVFSGDIYDLNAIKNIALTFH